MIGDRSRSQTLIGTIGESTFLRIKYRVVITYYAYPMVIIERQRFVKLFEQPIHLTTKVWRFNAFRRVQLERAFILKRKTRKRYIKKKKKIKQLVESNDSLRYVVVCIQLSTR